MAAAVIYERPDVYDIAFGYRDIAREVSVLLNWHARVAGAPPIERSLELAAGPARHSLALAQRGIAATALDLSPDMCAYARQNAEASGLALDVREGDMRAFALETPVELAFSMLDSVGHVLDLDDLLAHLTCVREALRPGGIYVMEMAHPADFMTTKPRSVTRWVQRRGATEIRIAWGADGDPFDPTSQQGRATVLMRVTDGSGIRTVAGHVVYRRWTATEIDAAARLTGLVPVAWFGALDEDTPFSHDPAAWRMIPILQRPL